MLGVKNTPSSEGVFKARCELFARLFVVGFFSFLCWFFGWSSWSSDGGNSVALGGKTGIALNEKDDTFNEAPDTVAHHDEVSDSSEEAKDGGKEADATVQSDSGNDGRKHDNDKATSEQKNVKKALLFVTEVPVVGAELAEEDTEQAGGDSRFYSGWFSFLHEKLLR